jgi:hypothetical protein
MDTSGIQIKESEQKALADQALADFAAKEGIALDPDPSAALPEATGTKSMGPSSAGLEKA